MKDLKDDAKLSTNNDYDTDKFAKRRNELEKEFIDDLVELEQNDDHDTDRVLVDYDDMDQPTGFVDVVPANQTDDLKICTIKDLYDHPIHNEAVNDLLMQYSLKWFYSDPSALKLKAQRKIMTYYISANEFRLLFTNRKNFFTKTYVREISDSDDIEPDFVTDDVPVENNVIVFLYLRNTTAKDDSATHADLQISVRQADYVQHNDDKRSFTVQLKELPLKTVLPIAYNVFQEHHHSEKLSSASLYVRPGEILPFDLNKE